MHTSPFINNVGNWLVLWISKAARLIGRGIGLLGRFANSIAAGVLAVMMFLTATDVLLRYFFNRPILGSVEMTEFLMAILVSLGLGYCTLSKGHVTVDLLISRFSPRAQAIINSITCLVSFGLIALITWRCILYISVVRDPLITSAALHIPTFPFVAIVAFGLALFCLVLLVQFVDYVRQGVRK
jgi:TRAP-type C4-dicarboxylate transport system permease small subunit